MEIDFTKYKSFLEFRIRSGRRYIYDPFRKKWMVLTPEELVRQLALQYLLHDRQVPASRIRVERGMKVNERSKRFDVLVFDEKMTPWLLVECKAPNVEISQETLMQAGVYNQAFRVQFLWLTNGITHCCCRLDYENHSLDYLAQVPLFENSPSE